LFIARADGARCRDEALLGSGRAKRLEFGCIGHLMIRRNRIGQIFVEGAKVPAPCFVRNRRRIPGQKEEDAADRAHD
jgi:hypothetical protein